MILKLAGLGIATAAILSLFLGFHLSSGFQRPPAPPVIVNTTVNTYPVPTMPAAPTQTPPGHNPSHTRMNPGRTIRHIVHPLRG